MIQSQGLKTHFLTLPLTHLSAGAAVSPSEDLAPLKGLLARAGQGQESWTLPVPSKALGPTLCTEPELRRCEEEAATLKPSERSACRHAADTAL